MIVVAAASAFLAAWLIVRPGSAATLDRMCLDVRPETANADTMRVSIVEDARQRTALCMVALIPVAVVMWGRWGAVLAVPAALGCSWLISRLEPPSAVRAREEIARDLPLAVDLLAACAQVGRPPEQALTLVTAAVGGELGRRLTLLASRLALGADAVTEWRRLSADRQLGALGRTMVRTLESGAPLVDGLTRLADDRRRERRTHAQLKARSVGVKAAGPLALCFLPAFMLIGVVPTVAGAFTSLVLT